MDDRELDAILRQGLILANSPDRLNLPDEPFPTSESFERRMAQLLKHPVRYARKHRRAARPMWQKVLTKVGAAVLILTISAGGVIFAVPSARAWAYNVVVQWLEEYVGFHFLGEDFVTGNVWRPVSTEEEWKVLSAQDWDGWGIATLEVRDSIIIYFDYRPVADSNQFNVDREHTTYHEVTVNGNKAYFFLSKVENKNSYLVWINEEENMAFMLEGYADKETLIRVAESVKLVAENIS